MKQRDTAAPSVAAEKAAFTFCSGNESPEVFESRVGNTFHFSSSTSVRAQGGNGYRRLTQFQLGHRLLWCLSVVAQIWSCFGRAVVDLFASKGNTHCPLFFFHRPLGMDALGYFWPHSQLYAFLPLETILSVLERVCQQGLSVILVAPCWPVS